MTMVAALMNGASSEARKTAVHRDFLRPADALRRMQVVGASPFRFRVRKRVPIFGRNRRLDIARRDRVHANAARRVFDRERARQSHDRVLRDRVGEASRDDLESVGRGDIDDRSAARLDHSRQKCARAAPDAFEIDGHAAIPILIAHCERIAKHIDAGVVDEDVGRRQTRRGSRHASRRPKRDR